MHQGPAEAPEVQQSFAGAVEHDAHTVQQVNDTGSGIAHALDQGLVRQEVAAVDRIVQVDRRAVTSPLVLTAPLIPPWAQTECDRLTGTSENISTVPPASAT